MSDEEASGEGSASLGDGPDERVQAILDQAHERGEEGDFEGMAERLRQGLEDFPNDPFLYCWLGVAEREMGEGGAAYVHFRSALDANPTDPTILATIGSAIAAFDDPLAEGALRTAALMAPDL